MAIVDRLDISDDRPVYKFRKFFIENYKCNTDNGITYQTFMKNVIQKTEKEMESQ